jgi:hypothetical protein
MGQERIMAKNGKKSGSTRVATAKILKIAEQLGLETVAKAGWIKVNGPVKGTRLLVHTGKKGTNCVELVGFESEFAVVHPCPPAKTMTQLIDFNVEEKVILRNVFKTAKVLAALVAEAEPVAEEVTETPAEVVETPAEQVG